MPTFLMFFLSQHRHSAGGVGSSYVRAYVVRLICNAHAQVMKAENSITLTIYSSENVFIALGCGSEKTMNIHTRTEVYQGWTDAASAGDLGEVY